MSKTTCVLLDVCVCVCVCVLRNNKVYELFQKTEIKKDKQNWDTCKSNCEIMAFLGFHTFFF